MDPAPLYPLRLDPIYQYRIWGGRRLADWATTPLPGTGPIGEAWLLSDRDEQASVVSEGAFKGWTIARIIEELPEPLLGSLAGRFRRFPLLLKFLDARENLSVQVHPSDEMSEYIPEGETGKTEAWVVLETGAESRTYAGLTSDSTKPILEKRLENGNVVENLASFVPETGDSVLIPTGAVHFLSDVVVFEVQENSDVALRLYDWVHVDKQTNKPRPLQIEQALACIDYTQQAIGPITPIVETESPALREQLVDCEQFGLWRARGNSPFLLGKPETPRVLVCLSGEGTLEHDGSGYACRKGDVFLIPASVGSFLCRPGKTITMLEISLPDTL